MYTVSAYDDMVCDYEVVFEGTLEECRDYVQGSDECDDYIITAPDGFTAIE